MAGPSNIFTPAYLEVTTVIQQVFVVPENYDGLLCLRVASSADRTVLVTCGIGLGSLDPLTSTWSRVIDFEVEPGKPYDLEEHLDLPEGWAINIRASEDNAVVATVTGRKKEVV